MIGAHAGRTILSVPNGVYGEVESGPRSDRAPRSVMVSGCSSFPPSPSFLMHIQRCIQMLFWRWVIPFYLPDWSARGRRITICGPTRRNQNYYGSRLKCWRSLSEPTSTISHLLITHPSVCNGLLVEEVCECISTEFQGRVYRERKGTIKKMQATPPKQWSNGLYKL